MTADGIARELADLDETERREAVRVFAASAELARLMATASTKIVGALRICMACRGNEDRDWKTRAAELERYRERCAASLPAESREPVAVDCDCTGAPPRAVLIDRALRKVSRGEPLNSAECDALQNLTDTEMRVLALSMSPADFARFATPAHDTPSTETPAGGTTAGDSSPTKGSP